MSQAAAPLERYQGDGTSTAHSCQCGKPAQVSDVPTTGHAVRLTCPCGKTDRYELQIDDPYPLII